MKIFLFGKTYAIDSIEFTGDTLEAFVYDFDKSNKEDAVAIPFIEKHQIVSFMRFKKRDIDELNEFTSFDYFTTFHEQLVHAISMHYTAARKIAKTTVKYIIIQFVVIHVAAAYWLLSFDWYIVPFAYLIGILHLTYLAKKQRLF